MIIELTKTGIEEIIDTPSSLISESVIILDLKLQRRTLLERWEEGNV